MTRATPKKLKPMETAPLDGSLVDLWSPIFGWERNVWWDEKGGPEEGDNWITICPRPFTGWRKAGML
jgi:hypothetical protein